MHGSVRSVLQTNSYQARGPCCFSSEFCQQIKLSRKDVSSELYTQLCVLDFSSKHFHFHLYTQTTLGRVPQYNLRTLNLSLIIYLTICVHTFTLHRTHKCQHPLRRSNVRIIAHLLVFKSIQFKIRNKTLKLRTPKTFRPLKLPKPSLKTNPKFMLQKFLLDSRGKTESKRVILLFFFFKYQVYFYCLL